MLRLLGYVDVCPRGSGMLTGPLGRQMHGIQGCFLKGHGGYGCFF